MQNGYLPIRVKTLKSELELGFQLFLKLPHKYILYIDAQDSIDNDRLQKLKEKKIRKMYIKDADEQLYQGFIDRSLGALVDNSEATSEEKAQVIGSISENTCEQIFENLEDKKSYKKAQDATSNLSKFVLGENNILSEVLSRDIDELDNDMASRMQRHAVNSCSLTLAFAKYMELEDDQIQMLGVAAIFHDIGFTDYEDNAKEFFFKSIDELGADELSKYKEHPIIGARLLQDKEYASPDLLDLITNHEERVSGNGFPSKTIKVTPEQEILNLCIHYDRNKTCLDKSSEDSLQDISVDQLGNFNLPLIKKFKTFLKENKIS